MTVAWKIKRHGKPLAFIIGDELRRLRKEAGLSTDQLGQRMSMARPLVSRMERGIHMTGLGNFVRYCRAVGADPGKTLNRILKAHDECE